MFYQLGARVRAKSHIIAALIAFCAFAANTFTTPANAAAVKDYGKPGDPIELVIGYQPYYTESWSGVIMRDKKFYEKYLPKGSSVSFQVGLQGAIIVNGMLAGKVDVGYVGDMPGLVSTSHPHVRDVRIGSARRSLCRKEVAPTGSLKPCSRKRASSRRNTSTRASRSSPAASAPRSWTLP